MTELPQGWQASVLSDLADTVRGVTYNKSQAQEASSAGLVPILRANNIKSGKLSLDDLIHVPESCISSIQAVLQGDIVVAMSSGSRHVVGKTAQLETHWKGSFGAFCAVLRVSPGVDARYLYYFTQSYSYRSRASELASGVNINNLKPTHFEEFEVPVAPLPEQRRIAQELDLLLAQVETLKARIDSIPVFLKRFRQAVRVAALTGELERGRLVDSAKWKSCVLSDIALVETGKTPDRSESKYWTDGSIAWVTSAATGASTCEEAKEFVTHQAAKDCSLKIFAPGTLLLAMYGEGKTRGQVTELRIQAACNQACAAISIDKNLAELGFVKLRLEENYEKTRKMAAGGAQPNLNLGKVREIPISLPPKEIQADIVNRVNQLFTLADQLEAQALAAKQRIDALTQSLLAKAFRGELVPQDPNDEPASVLLERIRAQRAAAPKPKRGRKPASN